MPIPDRSRPRSSRDWGSGAQERRSRVRAALGEWRRMQGASNGKPFIVAVTRVHPTDNEFELAHGFKPVQTVLLAC
ncbi:hypothetical protein GCM10017711_28400 [Paeniglutamicibacter sulfureus]